MKTPKRNPVLILYDSLCLIMTLVAVTWTEGDKADVVNVRRMLCSRGISR